MAAIRSQEIKIGLFAIVAIVLTVIILSSLNDPKSFLNQSEEYEIQVRIASAAGLEPYNHVAYAGKRIGYLETIDIWEGEEAKEWHNETPIKLVLKVWDLRRLKNDSEIYVRSKSALGGSYLEITDGTPKGTALAEISPGEFPVLLGEPFVSIFDLTSEISPIIHDVRSLIQTLQTTIQRGEVHKTLVQAQAALASAQNLFATSEMDIQELYHSLKPIVAKADALVDSASPIVKNAKAASDHFVPLMSETREGIRQISGDASDLITQVNEVVDENRPKIAKTFDSAQELAERLKEDVGAVSQDLQKLANALHSTATDNRDEIDALLANLLVSSESLSSLLEQLDREPWRAVWRSEPLPEPDRTMAEWDERIYLPEGSAAGGK